MAALGLLLRASVAMGLDPRKPLRDLGLASWQQELPQNTVSAIVQTRDGYIWFGTYEGLVRYDGVTFTLFDRRTTAELGNGVINALYQDRAGSLWIGAAGVGAVQYRGGVFRRYGRGEGLPDGSVVAFGEDASGTLWAGTYAGVARFSGKRFEPVPGLRAERLQSSGLAADGQGAVFLSTEAGLLRYASGSSAPAAAPDGLAARRPRCLAADGAGTLWIGTDGDGLIRLQDGRLTTFTTRDGLGGDHIRALLVDREGSLWVGTEGGGLSRLRDGRVESLGPRDGLPGMVRSFCEDAEGSLWVGTNGGGLVCLKDQKLVSYGSRHGLATNVTAVLEDRAGIVWVGTDGGGLYRAGADGRFAPVEGAGDGSAEEAPGAHVLSLAEDAAGSLWVGTRDRGLFQLSRGRWSRLAGLPHGAISSVFADAPGRLWIGTGVSGLSRFEGGSVNREELSERLGGSHVVAFLKDSKGALWVASNGAGIAVFRNGTFTRYTRKDGLPSDQAYCFHEDAGGAVWIGTGGGLARWKDGRLSSISSAQGLFDDVAFHLLEDAQGRFWISCNRGIYRTSRRELEAVLDGRARSVNSTVYGVSDGMGSRQCNGATSPSAWKTRDGRLWFATVRGVSVVDPQRIPTNPTAPPVHIEGVIADGRTLPAGAPSRLAPGLEKLELHFTALSFLAPERVRFRYRLEGYDRDWIDAGTRRVAYYTRLPPGRFLFRVAACNDDGVWNEAGASLALELLPSWWRTWWAALLAGGALLGAALGLLRLRVRSLKRRTVELERKVEERTAQLAASEKQALEASRAKSTFLANMSHELRTPLNGILGFAQLLERTVGSDPDNRESLAIISRSGEHLLGLINDVLSLSKIEAGHVALSVEPFDLDGLLRDLTSVVRGRADAKSVEVALAARGLPLAVSGDVGKLRQVLLNLLGNAVKFTRHGRVILRAGWDSGQGVFEVEDTGPGIAPDELGLLFQPFTQTETGRRSQEGTGLGLALSRQLARLMGGQITATSVLGRGSTFRLELELPEAQPRSAPAEERRRVVGLAPGQPATRVLVVDDVPHNRLLLSRLLGSVGFEVSEASSGEQALDVWRAFAPRLVFIDKRMPGIGGLAATRRIRDEERQPGRARTAIVAVSASAMEHERGEILASGCDGFVAKPFHESAIFDQLAEHLGLTFVYEEGANAPARHTLEPARLARLPRDLRAALTKAFQSGDFDAAENAAERAREVDGGLATALVSAARDYRAEEALAALATAEDVDVTAR